MPAQAGPEGRAAMNRFITFEGIEGSGKSTQVAMAARHLRSRGVEPVVTREPGGTAIGDSIRGVFLDPSHTRMAGRTELLLLFAARAQHLDEVILPALQDGRVVLCDRYEDSTRAYQGHARGIPGRIIDTLSSLITGEAQPELTFLLDLPAEEGLARVGDLFQHGERRIDQESLDFHRQVREGFQQLAEKSPGRFRVLDASRRPEPIAEQVARELDAYLGLP
jgi:dTMP kinase